MTLSPSSKHWRADATLALVALMWGTTFVVVKAALTEISTFYFLALRFSLAATAIAPLLIVAVRAEGFRATLRGVGGGLIVGVFLTLGYALQTFELLIPPQATQAFSPGCISCWYRCYLRPFIGAGRGGPNWPVSP